MSPRYGKSGAGQKIRLVSGHLPVNHDRPCQGSTILKFGSEGSKQPHNSSRATESPDIRSFPDSRRASESVWPKKSFTKSILPTSNVRSASFSCLSILWFRTPFARIRETLSPVSVNRMLMTASLPAAFSPSI